MPSINRFDFLYDLLAPTSTPGEHQYTAVAWLANTDEAMLPLDTSPDIFRNRYALVVLYYSTYGAEWANTTGWLSGSSVCSWEGVESCSFDIGTTRYLGKSL
jgi:hypothetical protein